MSRPSMPCCPILSVVCLPCKIANPGDDINTGGAVMSSLMTAYCSYLTHLLWPSVTFLSTSSMMQPFSMLQNFVLLTIFKTKKD